MQVTDRYGTARAMAWDRIRPRLTIRSAWIDHTGELPVIEGTLIRLQVERLLGGHGPLPVWLWTSATGLTGEDVNLRWQAFLGGAGRARPAHPPRGSAGVQKPASEPALSGLCAETQPARPWQTPRLEEPASRHPLQRGQNGQAT
ncbi:hypothetical protein OIE50_02935 [Streptomyces canus]